MHFACVDATSVEESMGSRRYNENEEPSKNALSSTPNFGQPSRDCPTQVGYGYGRTTTPPTLTTANGFAAKKKSSQCLHPKRET